jgi:hypothetical protein
MELQRLQYYGQITRLTEELEKLPHDNGEPNDVKACRENREGSNRTGVWRLSFREAT